MRRERGPCPTLGVRPVLEDHANYIVDGFLSRGCVCRIRGFSPAGGTPDPSRFAVRASGRNRLAVLHPCVRSSEERGVPADATAGAGGLLPCVSRPSQGETRVLVDANAPILNWNYSYNYRYRQLTWCHVHLNRHPRPCALSHDGSVTSPHGTRRPAGRADAIRQPHQSWSASLGITGLWVVGVCSRRARHQADRAPALTQRAPSPRWEIYSGEPWD